MRHFLAVGLFLGSSVAAWADTPPATVTLPPLPKLESYRGLPPTAPESQAIRQQRSQALSIWLKQLSDDQRAAWDVAQGMPNRSRNRRVFGQQGIPDPGSGYDWRAVARFGGLTDSEIAQLEQDKLLVEDIALKQSFEAYTAPRGPVFITSDSVLNAFHVLFEDSFLKLENCRAIELRRQLELVLTQVRPLLAGKRNDFPSAELQPGWRHAQLVVGPALRLLGTDRDFFDAEVRDEIDRQAEKIRSADSVELPAWLGPPSRTLLAIDYRRCKPIGFYAAKETLQNYFRAVRWLQSIPFRADRDSELTAIGLLGSALTVDNRSSSKFFHKYDTLLGRPDDPALAEAGEEFQAFLLAGRIKNSWNEQLVAKRLWLLRSSIQKEEWGKLNDTLRLPPGASDKLAEIQFRVLSAYRLPETMVLAKTTPLGSLPNGLAVAVLLGSDFARRHLPTAQAPNLEAALTEARDDWQPNDVQRRSARSWYDRYLDTLAALSESPEPDAPAFMRGEPWAAKSCQTILSSWAQARHTFTLQAKQSVTYLGIADKPPGFVEPNPEFFRRLADLVEEAAQHFEAGGVFNPTPSTETGKHQFALSDDTDRQRWDVLKTVTRRLESLAHKQLRQQPWTPDEANFMRDYGEKVALVMGYFSNSYETPRDEAPRWATVASDSNSGALLAVAVGRPRLLRVLYPWMGGEVLCTGSVMSYYEYTGKKLLTDEEWKTQLDSPDAPALSSWLAPYLAR